MGGVFEAEHRPAGRDDHSATTTGWEQLTELSGFDPASSKTSRQVLVGQAAPQ